MQLGPRKLPPASNSPGCCAAAPRFILLLHAANLTRASKQIPNQLGFKHSSRSFPWKLSTCAFLHRPPPVRCAPTRLPLHPPRQKMPRCKLRPVVTGESLRHPRSATDPIQLPRSLSGSQNSCPSVPTFRVYSVIDAVHAESSVEWTRVLASRRVTRELDRIVGRRGLPEAIRCDNGPELHRGIFWRGGWSGRSSWCTSNRGRWPGARTRMWKASTGSCGMNV